MWEACTETDTQGSRMGHAKPSRSFTLCPPVRRPAANRPRREPRPQAFQIHAMWSETVFTARTVLPESPAMISGRCVSKSS